MSFAAMVAALSFVADEREILIAVCILSSNYSLEWSSWCVTIGRLTVWKLHTNVRQWPGHQYCFLMMVTGMVTMVTNSL
jgi:hypothetical protein